MGQHEHHPRILKVLCLKKRADWIEGAKTTLLKLYGLKTKSLEHPNRDHPFMFFEHGLYLFRKAHVATMSDDLESCLMFSPYALSWIGHQFQASCGFAVHGRKELSGLPPGAMRA